MVRDRLLLHVAWDSRMRRTSPDLTVTNRSTLSFAQGLEAETETVNSKPSPRHGIHRLLACSFGLRVTMGQR